MGTCGSGICMRVVILAGTVVSSNYIVVDYICMCAVRYMEELLSDHSLSDGLFFPYDNLYIDNSQVQSVTVGIRY